MLFNHIARVTVQPVAQRQQRRTILNWMTNYPDRVSCLSAESLFCLRPNEFGTINSCDTKVVYDFALLLSNICLFICYDDLL